MMDLPTRAETRRRARTKIAEHNERCRAVPVVGERQVREMVAKYLAARGGATLCPTVYLVPTRRAVPVAAMAVTAR
jgi:hypothetical protein